MAKLIGGIFLIIGTSLGAGMLALPVATASTGFFTSSFVLLGCWLVMTSGALLILEVSLSLPDNNNMISMAGATIGRVGQMVAWIVYLALLYALVSAYTSGGADVVQYLLGLLHIHLPIKYNAVIFAIILGYVVYRDVSSVDFVNRIIMSIKFLALLSLIFLILPHVKPASLALGQTRYALSMVTIAITSFGYATIIPTLRTYFQGNIQKLKQAILVGSIIPLLCYLAWDLVVLGSIPHAVLLAAKASQTPTSDLTRAIVRHASLPVITDVVRVFTSVCMFTSFLGVSLCLTDFWADGLKLPKAGLHRFTIMGLTFGLPLILVLFKPDIFLMGLNYAGIFCVILLVLLPALMAWFGRYSRHGIITNHILPGGRLALLLVMLVAICIIGFGIWTAMA